MDLAVEERLMGSWPRRLLHVPTLTSYEWQPGNKYGSFVRPKYNAISYTWGRWRLNYGEKPEVRPISIKGVNWPLPRIDPSHFTTAQFGKVIEETIRAAPWKYQDLPQDMIDRPQFLWLDIACIDQRESEPRSAAEVGRQGVIFTGAKDVFIWLTTRELQDFRQLIGENPLAKQIFERSRNKIEPQEHEQSREEEGTPEWDEPTEEDRPGWNKPTENEDSEQWSDTGLSNEHGDGSIAPSSFVQVELLLEDPWFSSLWTLQEAYLCTTGWLMSRDADLITLPNTTYSHAPLRLSDLLQFSEALFNTCQRHVQANFLDGAYTRMADLIARRGLRALATRNAIATYEAASLRTTSRPEDRVYGIQQIFDFRLGKSAVGAALNRTFTLVELEDELGEQLLRHFPVSSQFHVFTKPVEMKRQWRFNTSSVVPLGSVGYIPYKDESVKAMTRLCELTVGKSATGKKTIWFEGLVASLDQLGCIAKLLNVEPPYRVQEMQTNLEICLDSANDMDPPQQRNNIEQWLVDRFSNDNLQVLALGLSRGFWSCRMYGVVILRAGEAWRRLGVCLWETKALPAGVVLSEEGEAMKQSLEVAGHLWKMVRGLYGEMG